MPKCHCHKKCHHRKECKRRVFIAVPCHRRKSLTPIIPGLPGVPVQFQVLLFNQTPQIVSASVSAADGTVLFTTTIFSFSSSQFVSEPGVVPSLVQIGTASIPISLSPSNPCVAAIYDTSGIITERPC